MKALRKWEWYGHAAHLIVGQWCQFHLATSVGKYLVSTVGEYWPERAVREIHAKVHDPEWLVKNGHLKGDSFDHAYKQRFGYEEIGCDRQYETMVFKIGPAECKCGCGLPEVRDWASVDTDGYNDAKSAKAGHMTLCKKWARKGLK